MIWDKIINLLKNFIILKNKPTRDKIYYTFILYIVTPSPINLQTLNAGAFMTLTGSILLFPNVADIIQIVANIPTGGNIFNPTIAIYQIA